MKISAIINRLNDSVVRSAWERGVRTYALELLESLEVTEVNSMSELETKMLNGASNWEAYSEGGCSLIYDADIAKRLCTASELKLVRNGERKPNGSETWLGVQARALRQAVVRIKAAYSALDWER